MQVLYCKRRMQQRQGGRAQRLLPEVRQVRSESKGTAHQQEETEIYIKEFEPAQQEITF